MRKAYCTQNNGDCRTCSLVNYGLDCANNPVSTKPPRQTRWTRTMVAYDGFKGERTVQAVLTQIPEDLQRQLTGKQLGMVMSAVNKAYHNGKDACGCEIIDGDAIWINSLNALVELSDIKAIIASKIKIRSKRNDNDIWM